MISMDILLGELQFSKEIENAIRQKLNKDSKQVSIIAETAYDGEDFGFALCKRMPLTRLAVLTQLLLSKYDEYRSKGLPNKIIFDTFRDVSLRAKLYFEDKGKVGLSKDDVIWFRHIMNIAIFKIGALQFQPFEMIYLDEATIGEAYMVFSEKQKCLLPNGSPVINCHIQKGANLDLLFVEDSLASAVSVFSMAFPETSFRAFLCYSWLLFPPMTELLPQDSKIKQFANKFTIISTCNDSEQAWTNLFGQNPSKVILPPNASFLQEVAFKNPEAIGFACGIIEMSKTLFNAV